MSKTAITLTKVTCTDGTTDYNVGINPNTNADDKVQAFVDAFKSVAKTASGTCHGLPTKLILAMWGGESGWATGSTQNSNQNWSNMTYTSETNPVGNIGKGKNGWAKFEGRKKHANGFANFFINNSRYSDLIKYLKGTSSPDVDTCISYIANAGYGGSDHEAYIKTVKGWVSTIVKRSDIE